MRLTILGAIALAVLVGLNLTDQTPEAKAFSLTQADAKFPSGRWKPEVCFIDDTGNPSDKPKREQMLVCDVPPPEGTPPSERLKMHLVYANQGLWQYDPDLSEAVTFATCGPPPPIELADGAAPAGTDQTTDGEVKWQKGKARCTTRVAGGGTHSLTMDFTNATLESTIEGANGSRQTQRIQCEAKPVPAVIDCVEIRP